jgi:hypothetical protein
MRILCGMGIFKEVSPEIYKAAPLAAMYASSSPFSAAIIHLYGPASLFLEIILTKSRTSQIDVLTRLPDYFESNGFRSPADAYDGPFQYARDTKLHCFDWLATKPKLQQAFNATMSIARMVRGVDWFEFYPVSTKLVVNSPSEPVLVDIGGGLGHGLIALKKHHPDIMGRLILQDIPVALDDIKDLPPGIDSMAHDFFASQPIEGAKAYYMRNILHDWPDKQAKVILNSIRAAMSPESILLIDETVLPEWKVPLASAQFDFCMMAAFSSLERTEAQYTTLLEETRFELVKVWPQPGGPAMLFEAVATKT